MTTSQSQLEAVMKVSRKHLQGHLRVETVAAERKIDHYGDEYFHVWVVYDTKTEKLDPSVRASLQRRMRPDLREYGIECDVVHSFIDKSDKRLWPELFPADTDGEAGA